MTKVEKLEMAKELIIADLRDIIKDVETRSDDPEEVSFAKALKDDIATTEGIQEDQIPDKILNRADIIEFIQQRILKYPAENYDSY